MPFQNIIVGLIAGSLMGLVSASMGPAITTKEPDRATQGLLILWQRSAWQTVALTVLIAPLGEELLFRFAGISLIKLFFTYPWPIIITAIAFGLAHNQFPLNIISGVLGLVLGMIYWHFGLIASTIAHGTQNGVVLFHLWWRFRKRTGLTLSESLAIFSIDQTIQFYETGIRPREERNMMKTIAIPYHTGLTEIHIAEKNIKAVITAEADCFDPGKSEEELVRAALALPIGTPPLSELSKGKQKVVLITSDHTRSVPSKLTLPLLLAEIRSGNPDAEITILIATGLHRATTEEEMRRMFGDEIVDHERIAVNDAYCAEDFTFMGTLPSGAEFHMNTLAVDCDLLLAEGFIEPHLLAGFSGGRKSVLPGICNRSTVNENHSYQAVASPKAIAGVMDQNPIHLDMEEAARRAKLAFILNVAENSEKKVIAAFAGDPIEAHAHGVEFVRELAQRPAITGDIVVTSNGGYPLDQNLYQTPKAVTTAEVCAGSDGVIIMIAACADGIGGEFFGKLMTMGSVDEIDRYLAAIPPKETISEQWCVQIYARVLKKHQIILVSDYLERETVERANLIYAATPDEALEIAYRIKGQDAEVVVIPDGVSVVATPI